MAVKFSELPAAPSAQTSDVFAIADSGTSRKLTAAQLLTLIAAENPALGTSSLPPNNDLNDPTESGVYHTDASTLNAPGSNRMVLHMQRGSDRAAQFSIAAAATEQLEIQFRELSGDGWSAWTVLVDDGVIPAARLPSTVVDETVTITAGTGLTGGGDLSSDRTIGLDAATQASLALADTATQPGDLAAVATSGDAADLTGTLADARLSGNVHLKSGAGANNTGVRSTFFGQSAGENNTGFDVSIFGYNAGRNNNKDNLTAVGKQAADENEGDECTAIGFAALRENTGNANTALGARAGLQQTGDNNVFLGFEAGWNSSGSNCVYIGSEAGLNNTENARLEIKVNQVNTTPLIAGDFVSGDVEIPGAMTADQFIANAYTVSTLPSGTEAALAYASDGRKNGETAGNGTGVAVFYDGSNWIAVDSGQTVAA